MRVSEKGQVTIPKDIRDAFGIGSGTEVEFVQDGGAIVVRKVVTTNSRGRQIVERMRGLGEGNMTTDEIMALTRGE